MKYSVSQNVRTSLAGDWWNTVFFNIACQICLLDNLLTS